MGFLNALMHRLDGWRSVVAGLGTFKDKVTSFHYGLEPDLNFELLDILYEQDPIVAKIVEKPASAMMRGWRVTVPDADQDEIDQWLGRWNIRDMLFEVLVWEALFGGSALLIGINDGQPSSAPFDPGARPYTIEYVTSVDRHMLTVVSWSLAPGSSYFGDPLTYAGSYTRDPGHIHRTRMVVFPGMPVTKRRRRQNQGWGVSVIQRCWTSLRGFNSNWLAADHLMIDGSQGKFKIRGLLDMVLAGNEDVARTRVALMDRMRSVARAVVLDMEDEEFERSDTDMSGIPDFLDRNLVRVSTASDIPVSILAGRPVVALGGTDEASLRNWYDRIEDDREIRLTPRVSEFMRIAFGAQNGPTGGQIPEGFEVEYDNLWTATEAEEASINKTNAETLAIYDGMGVFNNEEIRAVALRAVRVPAYAESGTTGPIGRIIKALQADAHEGYCIWMPVDPSVFHGLPDGFPQIDPLHITMVYLPDKDADVDALIKSMESLATRPVFVRAAGWALFEPPGSSPESRPLVVLVDSPSVATLRAHLVRQLSHHGVEVRDIHPFTPHITMAYVHEQEANMGSFRAVRWQQRSLQLVCGDHVIHEVAL